MASERMRGFPLMSMLHRCAPCCYTAKCKVLSVADLTKGRDAGASLLSWLFLPAQHMTAAHSSVCPMSRERGWGHCMQIAFCPPGVPLWSQLYHITFFNLKSEHTKIVMNNYNNSNHLKGLKSYFQLFYFLDSFNTATRTE